jgi:chaperonin GroES
MKRLVPLNDRIVVKPIEAEEQMYGNIIIADMGKERPEMGEVIAVGPGRMSEYGKFMGVNVNVGDIVLLPKIGTIRVEFDGEEYYIGQAREILCKVEETYNPEADHDLL